MTKTYTEIQEWDNLSTEEKVDIELDIILGKNHIKYPTEFSFSPSIEEVSYRGQKFNIFK
jgi:hypothetical protein